MPVWIAYAPALLAIAGAIAALLLDSWDRSSLAAVVAAVLVAAGGAAAMAAAFGTPFIADGVLRAGGSSSVGAAACLVLAALAVAGADDRVRGRFAVLGALAAASCAVVAAASDIIVLLLAIETLSLCGFGLVALADSSRSREAAMKWFVQSAVAATVLIIGIGVLFAATGGTTAYATAAEAVLSPAVAPAGYAGLALILSALAFKAGAFPFHSWAPDAYETAPAPAAALLASAGKIAALVAIGTVLAAHSEAAVGAAPDTRTAVAMAALAAGSIVFGNLAALRQRVLARMLAYSGIAQVGYALVAAAAGAATASITLFAIAYGVAACGAFLVVAAVHAAEPGWDGSISGLAGLSARRPGLAASLAVFMFSLTGIPLTAGFWGKFAVFGAAAANGWLWLAVLGVVGSVVSFGYYGGVLRSAYLDEATTSDQGEPIPPRMVVPGPGRSATRAAVSLALVVAIVGTLPFFFGILPLLGPLLGSR